MGKRRKKNLREEAVVFPLDNLAATVIQAVENLGTDVADLFSFQMKKKGILNLFFSHVVSQVSGASLRHLSLQQADGFTDDEDRQ